MLILNMAVRGGILRMLGLRRSVLNSRVLAIAVGLMLILRRRLICRMSTGIGDGALVRILMLLVMRRGSVAIAHRWWRRARVS